MCKLGHFFVCRLTIRWNCCSTPGQICWFWTTCTSGYTITCRMNHLYPTDKNSTCCCCRFWAIPIWRNRCTIWLLDWRRFALMCPITSALSFSCFLIPVMALLVCFSSVAQRCSCASSSPKSSGCPLKEDFGGPIHSLWSWMKFSYVQINCSADVKGLMNRRHVSDAHDQVQQALYDYTLNCYSHVPVSSWNSAFCSLFHEWRSLAIFCLSFLCFAFKFGGPNRTSLPEWWQYCPTFTPCPRAVKTISITSISAAVHRRRLYSWKCFTPSGNNLMPEEKKIHNHSQQKKYWRKLN